MADKQLTPAFYSSSKRVFYALYDFLISQCGFKLPAVNAKSGTFTAPGDALVTGNFFVVETPDGAAFRQQFRFELNAEPEVTHFIHVSHAPWVGVAGGWNSGGATFDAPKSVDERLVLAQGTQKFTCVANNGRILALAWWTPDTYTGNTSFSVGGQIASVAGYDFALHGYVPGVIVAVTGTASNNRSYALTTDVTIDTIEDVAPNPVNETVVATLTPRAVATALYAGAIDKAHGDSDVRPAALRAGIFGLGAEWDLEGGAIEDVALDDIAFTNNWRRIHMDTSGGYVNLVDGWLQMFRGKATDWPEIQQLQPSASGKYTPLGALLCFSETVGQPRRELPAGSLDGVFLGPIGMYMQLLGADDELVVRDGLAAAWPSGVTP